MEVKGYTISEKEYQRLIKIEQAYKEKTGFVCISTDSEIYGLGAIHYMTMIEFSRDYADKLLPVIEELENKVDYWRDQNAIKYQRIEELEEKLSEKRKGFWKSLFNIF